MTDRELLELAAKAAGMTGCCAEYENPDRLVFLPDGSSQEWSPLTDDGDALRLAVKLNLQVECMAGQSAARTFNNRHAGCVDHASSEQYLKRDFDPGPYAATRRAVVRAAAEIGRAA